MSYEIRHTGEDIQATMPNGDLAVYEVKTNGAKRKVSVNQKAYQRWLAAGGEPVVVPYVAPEPVVYTDLEQVKLDISVQANSHIDRQAFILGIVSEKMMNVLLKMHDNYLKAGQNANPSPRVQLLNQLDVWYKMIIAESGLKKDAAQSIIDDEGDIDQEQYNDLMAFNTPTPQSATWDAIWDASDIQPA